MARTKNSLNTVYISERLRESLRLISACPLTAVVAPMGYGKTTAVNWYLAKCMKEENAAAIRINIWLKYARLLEKGAKCFCRRGNVLRCGFRLSYG